MSAHNIPFSNIKKKTTLNYPNSAAMGFCAKGLKNEFETAVVNEPSVFKPLKFYCMYFEFSVLSNPSQISFILNKTLSKKETRYR